MNAEHLTIYPVGTQFLTLGKRKDICTVVDVHKTYNLAGTLVRLAHVTTHEFMGQTLTNWETPSSSIARGIIALEQHLSKSK